MYSEKFSMISILIILALLLSTFTLATPAYAVSTGLTVITPTADNATNMAFVKPGGVVSVRYYLAGAGGDSNAMQMEVYPTSGPSIGTFAASRASGAYYTDNISISATATAGTYNLSVYNGTNPIVVKTGSVKVDNAPPTGSLLSPTASTVWKGGSVQNIYWTSTDAAATTENVTVTLDYSTNNGGFWTNIVTNQSYPQGQQSWPWTVAATDSTQCLIRMSLTDRAGNTCAVITSPNFTILNTAPTVTVAYPSATGLTWTAGASCNITWSIAGSVAPTLNYVLQYSINSGGTYPYTIATLNSRTRYTSDNYTFTAPYVPYASRNLLRVNVIATDSAGNTGNDTSDNDFTINQTTAPSVTLGSPNGGQNWLAGSAQNITFTMTDLSGDNLNYELQYTTNSSAGTPIWYAVAGGTGTNVSQGAKSVPWTVPAPSATSTDCKVRVQVTNKYGVASAWVLSASAFTITVSTTAPTVAVVAPNGGETLAGGASYNITYTATDSVSGNFAWLKIEYTLNDGGAWTTITTINSAPQAASGSGSFVWSVPDSAATQCRVRVTAHSQTGLETSAQSTNLFTITASTFAPQTTNVVLKQGWNLISLPLIPVNSNINSVMAQVSENVTSVWYYDTTNGWQSWKPGAPSDLTIMRDGKAYWVYQSSAGTMWLPVYGRVGPEPPDTMPTYTMAAGWNMVGFKSLAVQAANVYLSPLTPSSIYWYDAVGGTGYQRIVVAANMNPGLGYWVFFGTGGSFAP